MGAPPITPRPLRRPLPRVGPLRYNISGTSVGHHFGTSHTASPCHATPQPIHPARIRRARVHALIVCAR
eukprot:943085-Pleurochrysis_carterae.AAC.1